VYIVFLGAPGAGKGTQSARIATELGAEHIATGDLFRQAIDASNELGKKVNKYMIKGALVPDEITVGLIMERLAALSQSRAIFDGFPRNLEQAKALDEALKKQDKAIDRVVYIRVVEDDLVRRLSKRWICRSCQTPYGPNIPPSESNRCNRCGSLLYQRPDDQPVTVRKRLKVYFNETAPLIEYYRQQGKLLEVDGNGSVDSVANNIIGALGERQFIPQ
jgi:adenylate kinase